MEEGKGHGQTAQCHRGCMYSWESHEGQAARCQKRTAFMPCLFQGNQIPGIHFPHFPMFGNHPETWSKEN